MTALDETDVLDYGLMNGMDTRFWSAYAGYVLTKNTKAGLFTISAAKHPAADKNTHLARKIHGVLK